MADEPKPGEMPGTTDPKVEEPLTDAPKAEPKAAMAPSESLAELEKTREALKKANRESAERRKRLDELEAAEADRQKAAMTETEKAQARIKELETANTEFANRLKAQEHRELQTRIAKTVAKELGLSFEAVETLATRLIGETEEELAADAKLVFAVLPKTQETKPDAKLTPKLEPTNPANGAKGETDAQKRARLLGRQVNIWDADLAKAQGGGAIFIEKGE